MFLMASMLFALAAVSIPVIIHLLHRQRTTPVKWGAMQFLLETPLQLKRRRRVDHWLLMLLRIAAVALLVLALARPLDIEGKYNPLGDGLATDVGVVIDRSLSTGRRVAGGERTAYDAAVETLANLAKNMRPSDTVTIVLAEHRPQVHSIRLNPSSAAESARKLKDLGPGLSDASIPDAVQTARQLIADGKNARKMILVLSDEQRGGWSIDDHAAWSLALGPRSATTGTKLYSLPIAPDVDAANVSVRDVSIAPSVIGAGRPAQITATIANAGKAPVSNLSVQLTVDGKPADTRSLASVPAGESRTIRFDHTFAEPGSHWLKVHADLTADALAADNSAVVAANVRRHLPVLIIDGQLTGAGDMGASAFLKAAMQPAVDASQEQQALVQPKVVNVSGAAAEKLDDYAVVVVNDAPQLPAEMLAKLSDYARSGRGLWFILGPRTQSTFITRDLADVGLFAATTTTTTTTTPAPKQHDASAAPLAIEVRDPRHPALALITAAERNVLTGALTRQWWPLTQPGDASVLLATAAGDPLVLERAIGTNGGRVVVWATGVDSTWNNWPLLPNFVPLVNETIYHLATGQTRGLENRRLNAGQEIVWVGPSDPPVKTVTLTRPDASQLPLTPRATGGRQVLSYNDTFVPGLYELRFDQTAIAQPVYYGVGIDARELEAASLSPADHRWLSDRGFLEKRLTKPADLAAAVGAANPGQELWKYAGVLLLATLVLETFMTWRMVRHQSPVAVA